MNQEEDYGSDSDQSDEDFCPDKEAGVSDAPSEEASDDDVSEDDAERNEPNKQTKVKDKKQESRTTQNTKKHIKTKAEKTQDAEEQQSSRRSTRLGDESNTNGKITEKDELESDEEDKSRTDALWADFLSDVKPAASKNSIKAVPTQSTNGTAAAKVSEKAKAVKIVQKKITVTEIVDFAGEEVRVEKVLNADNIKENQVSSIGLGKPSSSSRSFAPGLKRPAAVGSGLGSILNQIGKKKKISVLEKTQLDWKSFKQHEGIDEELQTHNKGKDGYLERQDFLQRTDVRQFEIEKHLRQTKR